MVVAGAVALVTAPVATAQTEYVKPLGWYDDGSGAPTTVAFADVAANPDTQIAVGADSATGTAVVFRRAGDAWQQDALPALPASSALTDVAIAATGSEAWAVGTSTDGPLVLHLGAAGWSLYGGLPAASQPQSVAVRGTTALIGDQTGTLYTIVDGGTASGAAAQGAGPINGVALPATGNGFAVAGWAPLVAGSPLPPDNSVRIYNLKPSPERQQASASSNSVDMLAVAASSTTNAVAIDSTNATWRVSNTGSVQEPVIAGAQLVDVASTPKATSAPTADDWATEFLVGTAGTQGEAWRRERWSGRSENWVSAGLPADTPPLAGVSATAPENAWAVGAGGTILRFWRPPDPEAQAAADQAAADQAAADQAAADQAAADQAAADQAAADQAAADQAAADQAAADQAAADQQQDPAPTQPTTTQAQPASAPVEQDRFDSNGIVIDDSPAGHPRRPGTKRLLTNVRAMRKGRKLIVSFRLTAKARVSLTAKRGRKVVGRARMRTLRRGRRTIVLRFHGRRPPSSLKVVVRRVSRA